MAAAPCCDRLEVSVSWRTWQGLSQRERGVRMACPASSTSLTRRVLEVRPVNPSQNLMGVPREAKMLHRGVALDFPPPPSRVRLTHDNKTLSSDTEQWVASGIPCPRVPGGEGARPDGCTGQRREILGSVGIGPSHRPEPVSAGGPRLGLQAPGL